MACCQPYQFPFSNVALLDINYSADMAANLGPEPKVEVFYRDPDTGEFYTINGLPGSQIKFDGSTIKADFGGIATGVVKVS